MPLSDDSERREHLPPSLRRTRQTGHAEVDRFLDLLRDEAQSALGSEFLGMYVGGSLALGAFDRASDIDVVIVTAGDVLPRLERLDAAHRRLARERVWFATQLECVYIAQSGLRRIERGHARHLKLDRGPGETLTIDTMDEGWIVHCHVLRTHGITWHGPDPATLIDDVSPQDLRAAMRGLLAGWAGKLLREPEGLRAPGYQSYAVLSLCRILRTLEEGTIVSKAAAARWAATRLPTEWQELIAQALADRLRDGGCASDEAVSKTRRFIEFAQRLA